MATVSMVDLRRDTEAILQRVGRGERLMLTYRGRRAGRPGPFADSAPAAGDPVYRLAELSVDRGDSLANEEMDTIVYGQ